MDRELLESNKRFSRLYSTLYSVPTKEIQYNDLYKAEHFKKWLQNPAFGLYLWSNSPGCVDCETEYLTPTGWKKISTYNKNDIVGEYNKDTGECEFRKPEGYIKELDNTEAFKIKGNRINMFLTGEHTVCYKTKDGILNDISMEKLNTRLQRTTSKTSHYGIVSNYKADRNLEGIDLSELELRLMVAVIADGSFNNKTNYCRISIKKERKQIRLRKLLKDLGYNFKEKYYNLNDLSYISFMFYAPRTDKIFTEYYWKCNSEQLNIIYNEYVYWDGYIDYRNGVKVFTTTKKESSDFIQYVISTCSIKVPSTSCSIKEGEIRTYNNGKQYVRKSNDYSVRETTQKKTSVLKTQIKKEKLTDGYKYCFTTSTGYWIARRGNFVFITGNSGKTTTAIKLAKHLMNKGYRVLALSLIDYKDLWKAGFGNKDKGQKTFVDYVYRYDFILLDDISYSVSSDWMIEILKTLLDRAFNNKKPKLILTSQVEISNLCLPKALQSRIQGICHSVHFPEKDIRASNKFDF